jgi:hypothetical protein
MTVKAAVFLLIVIAAWAIFMGVIAPRPAHGKPCCYTGHLRICPCQ